MRRRTFIAPEWRTLRRQFRKQPVQRPGSPQLSRRRKVLVFTHKVQFFIVSSSRYEGEFSNGWFHGHGTFWRADGMRYEGEYRGGKIWGLGLVTFNDDSHGFPRCEGYFENCKMLKRQKCPEVVLKAQMVSLMARKNSVENLE